MGVTRLKIGITGATGLIGRNLCTVLLESGHQLRLFIRKPTNRPTDIEQVQCDLVSEPPSSKDLAGLDAVVHLAGESIASGRWTKLRRKRIWESRISGTRNLVHAILSQDESPLKTFISASATGFYGNRGEVLITEEQTAGNGWLAELSSAWEDKALRLEEIGIRVVVLRFGVVLSNKGGALPVMAQAFRLGLGGKLGSGRQYMPWIHIRDVHRLIRFALEEKSLSGPVIAAADSVTNAEFTRTLSRTLHRPALFRVPAPVLKLALGQMAEELLLSGQRVVPQKARKAGFEFRFKELGPALRNLLS